MYTIIYIRRTYILVVYIYIRSDTYIIYNMRGCAKLLNYLIFRDRLPLISGFAKIFAFLPKYNPKHKASSADVVRINVVNPVICSANAACEYT